MKKIITLMLFLNSILNFAQYTSIPDSIFEQELINQGIDSDGTINGQVLTSDIINVTNLYLQGLNINDLTGIEDFDALEYLNCKLNNLTELNITSNINLKELKCGSNPLSLIDLSQNTILEILDISVTDIENLNLENNTSLVELQCIANHSLENINLTNLVNLELLYLGDNWNLSDIDLSNCINLETLSYDNTFNSLTTTLNVENNVNLKHLYFTGFPINTINLNNNTQLETLSCTNNALTSLDLANNTSLLYLDCGDQNEDYGYFNNITDLDLSNNINLEFLRCNNIGLENLNISNCINLEELHSFLNPINNLDVSANIQLRIMKCSNNNIVSIDLSNNTNLEILNLKNAFSDWTNYDLPYKNNFADLNLNNNSNLTSVNISRNEFIESLHLQNGNNQNFSLNTLGCFDLHCIYVDDVSAIPENWYIEPTSNYVETEAECESLTTEEQILSNNIIIYPNPAKSSINVRFRDNKVNGIELIDVNGKTIKQFDSALNELKIYNLTKGLYLLKIETENGILNKKILVK